jgi:hypothetical protein
VKKSIINRAQVFQDKIESRIRGLPVLSLGTYLFFLGMVFLFSGMGLFFYSVFFGVNPWLCQPTSSCFFYLVMGFLCFFVWIGNKYFSKTKIVT